MATTQPTYLTNNLANFAVDIYQTNPTFKLILFGESRGADESGEKSTLASGLRRTIAVKTQWAYLFGPAQNGHNHLTTFGLGGTDVARGGTLADGVTANPFPGTVHSKYSAAHGLDGGTSLGTFESATDGEPTKVKLTVSVSVGTFIYNEPVAQATSGATGRFISESGGFVFVYVDEASAAFDNTHTIAGTGRRTGITRTITAAAVVAYDQNDPQTFVGDPGNTNITPFESPITSKARLLRGGNPFTAKSWVRVLAWRGSASVRFLRFLARRNATNSTPDNSNLDFTTGTGFQTVDAQIDANAGRLSGFLAVGSSDNATAGKDLNICGAGIYAAATAVIPAGPRFATIGKSAQTLADYALYIGDDLGIGATPYCTAANAQAAISFMSGGDGSTSGPTHYIIYCVNRDSVNTINGTTELADLNAGISTTTLYTYRRIIARLNTIGVNLNGVKPKILIITPGVAGYDATPYSSQTVQDTIANARAAAGHQASVENSNVSHLNTYPVLGPYPLDTVSRPMYMATGTTPVALETLYTHYNALGGDQMVASYVDCMMQIASLGSVSGGNVPFQPSTIFRLDRLPGR